MRAILTATLGLGLVALLAGPAAAQGRGGFGMIGGGGYAMLLGNESVQKELKLDDQQVEKAKELAEKTREKMTAARSSSRASIRTSAGRRCKEINKEMNESTMKAVGEFLKPEQITRLKQISYQTRGAAPSATPRSPRS